MNCWLRNVQRVDAFKTALKTFDVQIDLLLNTLWWLVMYGALENYLYIIKRLLQLKQNNAKQIPKRCFVSDALIREIKHWNNYKTFWDCFGVVSELFQTPSLFVLAFYNEWEHPKTYTYTETLDVPSTSFKNFVNFSAVNHWDEVSLQKVGECTTCKIRTFALFPPEPIDWSSPNLQKL